MFRYSSIALALAACLAHGPGAARAERIDAFALAGDWWQVPAGETRLTTLACSFDSEDHADADFARGGSGAGGFGMDFGAEGAHGGGVAIAERGGHLHYAGGSNFPLHRGTLRMRVRGDVWSDETPRWLFEARAADRIGVRREPGRLSLVFSPGKQVDREIARLDLDIGEPDPDAWHSVVASWDRTSGRGWIAFNGRGVSGPMEFSKNSRAAFVLYLGGGFGARLGGLNDPGLAFDDFAIYAAALPVLEHLPEPLPDDHEAFLAEAEAAARLTLDTLCNLQRCGGGWQTLYTWPTLIGSSAQGREWVDFDDYLDNDKGNGSPRVAAYLLYGYQVLGDHRYMDAAWRTAEFLLAAQDERGFWVHGYRTTPGGLEPLTGDRHIKFQDQVQAHPIFFLRAMYRQTGDARYAEAVARAGEFYLAAQNPNGSWSHHFDAPSGMGRTARGQPQGGELNDEAMNDAIDMMAFFYHQTGDLRYREALQRAGEWLIAAQGGKVPLWADQYDRENTPVWARHFEPPSYGVSATRMAARALVEVYRFTGEDRYLAPIRRTIAWAEENLEGGLLSAFIDPESGRPIAGWQREVFYLDEPDAVARLQGEPIGSGYLRQTDILTPLRRVIEAAPQRPSPPVFLDTARASAELTDRTPGDVHPVIAPERERLEAWVSSLGGLRGHAAFAIETQNEAGVWVRPVVADFLGSLGAGFSPVVPRLNFILRYVERARIARGEIGSMYRGDGNLKEMAFPEPGWYDIGLR